MSDTPIFDRLVAEYALIPVASAFQAFGKDIRDQERHDPA